MEVVSRYPPPPPPFFYVVYKYRSAAGKRQHSAPSGSGSGWRTTVHGCNVGLALGCAVLLTHCVLVIGYARSKIEKKLATRKGIIQTIRQNLYAPHDDSPDSPRSVYYNRRTWGPLMRSTYPMGLYTATGLILRVSVSPSMLSMVSMRQS